MKKVISLLVILTLLMVSVIGCSSGEKGATSTQDEGTIIELGEDITIEGEGASVEDQVVTITSAGTYSLSGTLEDGMVKVDAKDQTVNLVLAGADITNSEGPAILVSKASDATVTLKEGTSNKLTDGGSSDYDAALCSKPSLTIKGEGALTVSGNNNEGISSEKDITIESGNIWVKAVEDGLNANNDGVSAITVKGGYLYVESETGDGIDSNGTIDISGGTVIALSALGDASGGLDADGEVTVTGGTVIATGAQLSTPGESSTQKSILVSYSSTQKANTLVAIQQDGKEVLTLAPALAYQSLLYSSDSIADDVSYVVYSGGSATGDASDGLYINGTYTAGTKVSTVTTESITEAQNKGPMGGPQGGGTQGGTPQGGAPQGGAPQGTAPQQ